MRLGSKAVTEPVFLRDRYVQHCRTQIKNRYIEAAAVERDDLVVMLRHVPERGEQFGFVGAGDELDRAALGVTRVRRGTKLDNLVQVGHNVVIGEDTVVAARITSYNVCYTKLLRMISSGAAATGGILRGVDLPTVGTVTRLPRDVRVGRLEDLERAPVGGLPRVILGKELAANLGVAVGDIVEILVPGSYNFV